MKFKTAVTGSVMLVAFATSVAIAKEPIPVVDASPGSPGPAASGQSNLSVSQGALSQVRTSSTSNTAEMLYQLELLQQEVQTLRGIVEEQAYQINQMREEQRDRYMDLDRRITILNQSSAQTKPAVQPVAPVSAAPQPAPAATPVKPASTGAGTQKPAAIPVAKDDEKTAYQTAFGMVRSKEYSKAAGAFEQLIKDYPDGSYTGNAYYWLGEVQLVESKPEEALKAFGALLNQYPSHRKAADAKYKQGKIYLQLGDKSRAKQLLQSVVDQHAGSSAAKLAEAEMRDAQL